MTAPLARRNPWRAVLAAVLLVAAGSTSAATFVVNDRFDAGTGGCTAAECTLREAIVAANATATADTINFTIALPRVGDILIQPATALPTIIQPVSINGYSQSGTRANDDPVASNAAIRIRVDGFNAGTTASGLAICANNVVVKGLSITRFSQHGIQLYFDAAGALCGAPIAGATVSGNFIGLAGNGTTAAGNSGAGVSATSARIVVGSAAVADRNVIGSNAGDGIFLINAASSTSSVLGNLIGTDRSGVVDRGNGGIGVDIANAAAAVTLGSTAAPNRVAFNDLGVRVRDTSGNRLFENHYGPNDGLGIDLLNAGGAGVSPNDNVDADGGGNGQQNYLDDGFFAQRTPTGINIQGTLRRAASGPSVTFTIAAYATPACDASGHGEGEQFLGTATEATTTATATIEVDIPLTTQPPAGSFITTTVTSPSGDTSEFSTCAPLDPPPLVVNSTNDVADGVCNATHCSLREAILAANANANPSVINFNIASPASGELLIPLTSVLPPITAPVTIDGYTQPGTTTLNTDPLVSNAVLRVRVDGVSIASGSFLFEVCANDTTIRGLSITRMTAGAGAGVHVCTSVSAGVNLAGNFIGLASDGATGAGSSTGVFAQGPVTIGGANPADRNVIGANARGLQWQGNEGALVLGNLIGTDKSGALDRGNTGHGVLFASPATNALIGSAAAPNLIRFNARGIGSNASTGIAGHAWTHNRIVDSGFLGIDLNNNGLTPNDADDADIGSNGLQNFPVITLAERSAAGLVIAGTLDVTAGTSNAPYTIGVYANTACDAPSGHGEGERLLGAATVNLTQTTGESFSFELTTNDPLEAGVQITSTATGPEGSSEFSACVTATDAPTGIAVNSIADPGTGACEAGECTLREAIALANTQAGADLIRFEIPGDGPHDIQLASLLPVITEALTIDGYTEQGASPNAAAAGSDAVLQIQVNGLGSRLHLLRTCTSGAVEVRGLALVRASSAAIATQTNDATCTAVGSLTLKGNYVGLGNDGIAFSNGAGVLVRNTVATIGGGASADRNILSLSGDFGVLITGAGADGSTVQNNVIGVGRSPETELGNTGAGVEIDAASNVTVGGDGGLANLIAFNGRGVLLLGAGTGNRAYANEYIANDTLGIDLSLGASFDGVTVNDFNDVDAGPNGLQNFPQLSSGIASTNSITIHGTLDVPAGIVTPLPYTLAFYESAACDGSGNGEGELYLGSRQVDFTSAAENFSETLVMPPSASASVITATATDPAGNTSEFSNCLLGPQLPQPIFADGFEE